MRLDLFLKKTRLLKQRTLAKELCDAGLVLVNGRPAKPSQNVRARDLIRVQATHRVVEVRVLQLPRGNVARRDIPQLIHVLRDDPVDRVGHVLESDDADPEQRPEEA